MILFNNGKDNLKNDIYEYIKINILNYFVVILYLISGNAILI